MSRTSLRSAVLCALAFLSVGVAHAKAPASAAEEPPPFLDGLGTGGFPVATASAEAQRYFDLGMQLAWGFDYGEAIRAFHRAQQLDPSCAMCFWGEAYALGPNINWGPDQPRAKRALAAAERAASLARRSTEKERVLTSAIRARAAGWKKRPASDVAYAEAVLALAKSLPADDDVAVLAAEAAMVACESPWWEHGGYSPRCRIGDALSLVEGVLARRADHTAAIHMLVHITEWSADPFRALPHARRLAALAPRAGHLIHMPSHTFFRVGDYAAAVTANLAAIDADAPYVRDANPPAGLAWNPLHMHNQHFGLVSALMRGDRDGGRRLAGSGDHSMHVQAGMPRYFQFIGAGPYLLEGRLGTPESLAALPVPPADRLYVTAAWRLARTEHFVAAAKLDEARTEAAAITVPDKGPARILVTIAKRSAEGRIALASAETRTAVRAFEEALAAESSLSTDSVDPPEWPCPVRRSLAAALVLDGQLERATFEIQRALVDFPEDPRALAVLAEIQRRRGDAATAAATQARAEHGWVGDPALLRMERI